MKTIYYTLAICLLAFTSCQTLEVITIDQLVPSDLNFPESIRRVAIVNNVNMHAPANFNVLPDDTTRLPFEIARKVTFHDGDSKLTAESLAESIAEANYFDEVLISDSLLRANDKNLRETMLSQEEVNELVEELDVDMIIALESIQLKAIRTVSCFLEGGYLGTVDLKIYPSINIYIPNRKLPLAGINVSDSIFWEGVYSTQVRAQTQVISDAKMIEEASVFAGTLPVKYIAPYWKTVERVYYSTNKSEMRDASILARKGQWDEAYKIWKKVYESEKPKDQMRASLNIALYYEIKDDLDEAIVWVNKSLELAKIVEKVDEEEMKYRVLLPADGTSNFHMAYLYREALNKRKEQSAKLNMQMQRFEEEVQPVVE